MNEMAASECQTTVLKSNPIFMKRFICGFFGSLITNLTFFLKQNVRFKMADNFVKK